MTIQSTGFAGSYDKLKSLYTYFHKLFGYQTWQGEYIQYEACFHEIKKPFDHVILPSHVKYYIPTTTRSMDNNLWKEVNYHEKLPFINSHDSLSKQSCNFNILSYNLQVLNAFITDLLFLFYLGEYFVKAQIKTINICLYIIFSISMDLDQQLILKNIFLSKILTERN